MHVGSDFSKMDAGPIIIIVSLFVIIALLIWIIYKQYDMSLTRATDQQRLCNVILQNEINDIREMRREWQLADFNAMHHQRRLSDPTHGRFTSASLNLCNVSIYDENDMNYASGQREIKTCIPTYV